MTEELEKLMSMTPATVPTAKWAVDGQKAMAADRLHCLICAMRAIAASKNVASKVEAYRAMEMSC